MYLERLHEGLTLNPLLHGSLEKGVLAGHDNRLGDSDTYTKIIDAEIDVETIGKNRDPDDKKKRHQQDDSLGTKRLRIPSGIHGKDFYIGKERNRMLGVCSRDSCENLLMYVWVRKKDLDCVVTETRTFIIETMLQAMRTMPIDDINMTGI